LKTNQFEALKVSMRQDRTGYILTLSIHPDEVPEQVLRDFVGARYQVVMVRLSDEETPLNRDQAYSKDIVRNSAILCRDPGFHRFLLETGQISVEGELAAAEWLREELQISSRAELKENLAAARHYNFIYQEYTAWKHQNA
jgi:hypothetical protein